MRKNIGILLMCFANLFPIAGLFLPLCLRESFLDTVLYMICGFMLGVMMEAALLRIAYFVAGILVDDDGKLKLK